eukprot:TRINITY_DN3621_c2_g1_i1.p2 TRINITY_DN3621_c2_g1~~TRINITY_DN3621_c2_g1_i1.p2  ORF type:complete len:172 (+),score=37.40 TRINITY_DN3621_c2_g1_i1:802-1317(+)
MACGPVVTPAPFTFREAWDLSKGKAEKMYAEGENFTGSFLPLEWMPMPGGYAASATQMDPHRALKNWLKYFPIESFVFVEQREDLSKGGVQDTLKRIVSQLPSSVQKEVDDGVIRKLTEATIHTNSCYVKDPSAEDPVLLEEIKQYHAPRTAALQYLIKRDLCWGPKPKER